jgi:hypothetical protein
MVERDMLICKQDSTGTEKYYLSKWPSDFVPRQPEDNPDIETTTPTHTASITIRLRAGLKLINSRKKKSPPPAAANTKPTVASAVAAAEAAAATSTPSKRQLNYGTGTPPLQSSLKKRATTKAATRKYSINYCKSHALSSIQPQPK